MRQIAPPQQNEHVPYINQYLQLVPLDGNVLSTLDRNFHFAKTFLESIPTEKLLYRYAENKWTIKEIVQHISDDERIYTYRALRFARNDGTELPGFDQDDYTGYTLANNRSLDELLSEMKTVRAATISLFEALPEESLTRKGVASGNIMSVRAIAYHIAGHEQWHLKIIRERYLG